MRIFPWHMPALPNSWLQAKLHATQPPTNVSTPMIGLLLLVGSWAVAETAKLESSSAISSVLRLPKVGAPRYVSMPFITGAGALCEIGRAHV